MEKVYQVRGLERSGRSCGSLEEMLWEKRNMFGDWFWARTSQGNAPWGKKRTRIAEPYPRQVASASA
eukprot:3800308-Pyramimonas_sp.AAC.1